MNFIFRQSSQLNGHLNFAFSKVYRKIQFHRVHKNMHVSPAAPAIYSKMPIHSVNGWNPNAII